MESPSLPCIDPSQEEERGIQIAQLHARFLEVRRKLERKACEDIEQELVSSKHAIKQLQDKVIEQQQLLKQTRTELKARLKEVVIERNVLQEHLMQATEVLTALEKNEAILVKKLERKDKEMKAAVAAAQAAASRSTEEELRAKLAEVQKLAAEAMEQFQSKLTKQVVRYETRMTAQLALKDQELQAAREKIAELERQLKKVDPNAAVPDSDLPTLPQCDTPVASESSSPTGNDAWSSVSLRCSISLQCNDDDGASWESLTTELRNPSTKPPPTSTSSVGAQDAKVGLPVPGFEFPANTPSCSPRITALRQPASDDLSVGQANDADSEQQRTMPAPASPGTPHPPKKEPFPPSFPGFKRRDLTGKDREQKEQSDTDNTKDQHRHDQEAILLEALRHDPGFEQGQPVAAQKILQFCVEWDLVNSGSSPVFDSITQLIDEYINHPSAEHEVLAYWLTNTSALVCMLRKYENSSRSLLSPRLQGAQSALASRLPGFLSWKGKDADDQEGGGDSSFTITWFRCQLEEQICQLFAKLRSNFQGVLLPDLEECVCKEDVSVAGWKEDTISLASQRKRKGWDKVIATLEGLRLLLTANHVPPVVSNTLLKQLLRTINAHLFNQLLLRSQCCTFSQGQSLRAGLAMLEMWLTESADRVPQELLDETAQICQAAHFLVLANKATKSLEEIQHWCPDLSMQHLYCLAKAFRDDQYHTDTVSSHVLQRMKDQNVDEMTEDPASPVLLPECNAVDIDRSNLLQNIENHQIVVKPANKEAHGASMSKFWERSCTNMQSIVSAMQVNVFS